MKYAVIQTGGKQYKVSEGDTIAIEKLDGAAGQSVQFENVLLLVNGSVKIGQPYVPRASITGKVLDQIKGPKIRVAKFKAKARYRRVMGHRQQLTKVLIESIGTSAGKVNGKPQKSKVSVKR